MFRAIKLGILVIMMGMLVWGNAEAMPAPQADVLPAPLYFIDVNGLISRLETDGITQSQVVLDTERITAFDIAPNDGRIAYVVANNLVIANSDGSNPQVMFEGGAITLDEGGYPTIDAVINTQITDPRWSPDGSQIVFGRGGLHILNVASGEVALVLANGEPDPASTPDMPFGAKLYRSANWSPDGSKLLVGYSWVPEGGGYVVLDLASGAVNDLMNPATEFAFCCGQASWSADSTMLYYGAASALYPGEAGLWTIDVNAGTVVDIGSSLFPDLEENLMAEFSAPQILDDGRLYFFFGVINVADPANSSFAKQMFSINLDGSDLKPVRPSDPTGYAVFEVLWAPDGSGSAVTVASIVNEPISSSDGRYFYYPMEWLAADQVTIVELGYGANLRWGQ